MLEKRKSALLKFFLFAALGCLMLLPGSVLAAKQIALVIGNAEYPEDKALKNPHNDAREIAAALKALGFEVISSFDANRATMEDLRDRFGRKAEKAQIALVYYAGHGIQVDGNNYLIPVNAEIRDKRDLRRLIKLDSLVAEAGNARKVGVVILDACRNNPYEKKLAKKLKRNYRGGRGLARVDSAPRNTLVAFATKANDLAEDGDGRHSPYAAALLKYLPKKNLEIRQMFGAVRDEVLRNTGQQQTPYTYGSLGEESIYLGGSSGGGEDSSFWKSMQRCGTPSCIQAYLDRFPKGKHKKEAHRAQTQVAAIDLTPLPETSPDRQAFEPALVRITGGCFQMGTPESKQGRYGEDEYLHRVCVEDFELGKREVTVGDYRTFVETTGYRTEAEKDAGGKSGCRSDSGLDWVSGLNWQDPGYKQGEDHPVVCLSWNDAVAYVEWLSEETGKDFRLPTEAEWEYGARAGNSSNYYPWGNKISRSNANYGTSSCCRGWVEGADLWEYTSPVGSFRGYGGLHDMIGNVAEWTCSEYDISYKGGEQVCTKKNDAGNLAIRGGSWRSRKWDIGSAARRSESPNYRDDNVGFRVARTR